MRVLLINSRGDATQHPGGDTVQLQKTQAALESLGLRTQVGSPQALERPSGFDLVHIFNIQDPQPAWAVVLRLKQWGIPALLSPIYWDLYAYWYELAVEQIPLWRQMARFLGKKRVGEIYIRWQRLKEPKNRDWQLQRDVLLAVDRVLPNSKSEIDVLQNSFGLNHTFEAKADVVPNAIDAQLYEALPAPNENFSQTYGIQNFILQVARIHPAKNQLGLIEALFDLPVPLVFVGQVLEAWASYANACRARAAERGNVYFVDQLPHEDLPGVYALAAVHALPSWRETPGLVSLEAAAAGCKVVTTAIGSTREYFGDQAWYCYPDDHLSIRKAVEAALNATPSESLRQRVLTEYTWERAAQATLASYEKVLIK
jgi:glycosyltransferase involved in cell wall biosynthesis